MSWSVRSGHEHNFIDGRTHVHHIHLFNQVTGGEHSLELLLGCPTCPACKRPFEQSDLSLLDPNAEVEKHLAILGKNHEALMAYASRGSHMIRVGPLANFVPYGHKLHEATRMLQVPKMMILPPETK